jgi:hypothetical protein
MTRARDTADTQDNLGGAVAPYVGAKNLAINGGFDFWQRGTSSTSSGVYLADRWIHGRAGGASGGTYTRQTATDSSSLPFLQYAFRLQRDSGNTGTAQLNLNQVIETANSVPLAGKTITLSFYARVGANFSATSGTVATYLFTGTGTDQNGVLGAWTGAANPLNTSFTGATTTWQRFQATATLSSTTNEIYFGIGFTPTGTAGAADWLEITGVQLELGAAATPFARAGGSIGGELALCQRYYYRLTANGYQYFCTSANFASTSTLGTVTFPVTMRTSPSLGSSAGNTFMVYEASVIYVGNAVPASDGSTPNTCGISQSTTGLTAGRASNIRANNTAAYLEFIGEL